MLSLSLPLVLDDFVYVGIYGLWGGIREALGLLSVIVWRRSRTNILGMAMSKVMYVLCCILLEGSGKYPSNFLFLTLLESPRQSTR